MNGTHTKEASVLYDPAELFRPPQIRDAQFLGKDASEVPKDKRFAFGGWDAREGREEAWSEDKVMHDPDDDDAEEEAVGRSR